MPEHSRKPVTINVLYRLEPGCLGPTGEQHIEAFCSLANQALTQFYDRVVSFQIEPRYDKSLPEVSYAMGPKKLSNAQAATCLQVFDIDLDDFEDELHGKISHLTGQYLARL